MNFIELEKLYTKIAKYTKFSLYFERKKVEDYGSIVDQFAVDSTTVPDKQWNKQKRKELTLDNTFSSIF